MEDAKEKKELEVFSPAKSAYVTITKGVQPRIGDENRNSIVFIFPDTEEIRQALEDFSNDGLIPAKTFTDLTQSLKQQMLAAKKYGKQS